jgi:hypothetical protein
VLRVVHAEIRIHSWLDAWCLGCARFDWDGGPVWGWDALISGDRAILRLVLEQRGPAVLLTNGSTGRALYRSLFPALMRDTFGVGMPPLHVESSRGSAGDLARFAGLYAWPDRRCEVTTTSVGLLIADGDGAAEAWPVDDRTFVVDAADPDIPTVTFGAFDNSGRPAVLYQTVLGAPARVERATRRPRECGARGDGSTSKIVDSTGSVGGANGCGRPVAPVGKRR